MKKTIILVAGLVLALVIGWAVSGYAACKVGDKAQVQWKGSWYAATVKKAKGDQCFIHYDGYGANWDEWVGPERIRIEGAAASASADTPKGFSEGDAVQVLWKGSWYPAHVLSARNGKYRIHYDGYDSSWDETVGPSRIKK